VKRDCERCSMDELPRDCRVKAATQKEGGESSGEGPALGGVGRGACE
jgi:hypothetical protein